MLEIDSAGKRIKILRVLAGLNQAQLATRCGYDSQGQISMLESGQRNVTAEVAQRLAGALNTNPAYLLLQTNDPKPEAACVPA